jgi:hypothetical protein
MFEVQTNTDEVGQVMLEKYHEGHTEAQFRISIVDPTSSDVPPKNEVRDVTLIYEG